MVHRTIMLVLTLLVTLGAAWPSLAEEATTRDDIHARTLFLPLVKSGQAARLPAISAPATRGEEDLTDEDAEVEAAGAADHGLVFVSTNAADPVRGNEVVMYRRGSDGSLAVSGRFPTGGQGLGGGLGSQNALLLSKNGHWLFVVNAGSNEISVFAVFPTGLILTGKVASGGLRPTSLTVSHNLLYVLNAGNPGNITGFKLGKDGQLTPLAGSTRPLSNDGFGAAPAPAQASFAPDGKALVVTERATNRIDTYTVNQNGRVIGPVVHPSAGATPFGFASDNTLAVSSYRVNSPDLQAVSALLTTGQTAACWIVSAGGGKYAYSANAGSASLFAVGDSGQLTLLDGRAGDTGPGPTDTAVSHNGRWLYVLSPHSQTVVGFAVGADGSLVLIGSFAGLPPNSAGIAAW
jgi:6-phosphogluconolactonase (cycloisomerase 2 family)